MSSKLETELLLAMERNLLLNQGSIKNTNIDQATNYLQAAKEIFEEKGYIKQANSISYLLFKIAKQTKMVSEAPPMHLSRATVPLTSLAKAKKDKRSDKHTKNLSPENMIKNLKNHGTVFNMDDDKDKQEYQLFLSNICTSPKMEENILPEFRDLLADKDFNMNFSDDDILNLEVKEDELMVSDKNIEDFEDEIS